MVSRLIVEERYSCLLFELYLACFSSKVRFYLTSKSRSIILVHVYEQHLYFVVLICEIDLVVFMFMNSIVLKPNILIITFFSIGITLDFNEARLAIRLQTHLH